MTSVIKNIVYGQKYTSQGEERMKWTQCGILIEKDGRQYIKMQFIPIGIDPDGGIFFNVFEQGHGRDRNRQDVPADSDYSESDDIPF